jgi:hypothetical protein
MISFSLRVAASVNDDALLDHQVALFRTGATWTDTRRRATVPYRSQFVGSGYTSWIGEKERVGIDSEIGTVGQTSLGQ